MENSMLNNLLFDPAYLIIGLAVLTVALMILTLVCFSQYRKLYRRYDMFMRGKDAETLEDIILDLMDEAVVRQATDKESREQLKSLTRQVRASYQKIGIVKYNAFKLSLIHI